jgi:hypothetical protein
VWVTKDGTIEMNGVVVDLAEVERTLQRVDRSGGGTVLYGRDAASEEPHPIALKVIELVTRTRLPVRLSTKRDFSDAVDSLGNSVPVGRE